MAWFSYKCEEHGIFKVSLEKREKTAPCPHCNKPSCVIIKMGTIQVCEKLDNGAMARAVERLHDVEEIMEERSKKHSKEHFERLGIIDDEK